RVDQLELAPLLRWFGRGRRPQMQNRTGAAAERRSLVRRRHEAGAPVACATRWFAGITHHHKTGQVLILAAQPVEHPRPHAGPAGEDAAGVHLADRTDVIQTIRPTGANYGQIIDAAGNVREPIADFDSRLAVFLE